MVTGIIGQKVGMTQVFADDGTVEPATVLKAGPCVVVQQKSVDGDGYVAVQLGLVQDKPARVNKALAGHYQRAGVPPTRVRREVKVESGAELPKTGDEVLVSLFAEGDRVDITGMSKGRGFQGVMKRHGFHGGGATHGSMFHRAPGSIGQSSYPSRVFKGMKGPGRMGGDRVTVSNLRVIQVDADTHRLVVRGAVPGASGGYVVIRKAIQEHKVVLAQDDAPKKKDKGR
jgi:large subunit ribosomal protein L3